MSIAHPFPTGNDPAGNRNYLSVREAAEKIGAHQNTIRAWISEGRLKAVRFSGRLIRIDAADLEAIAKPYTPIDRQVWG